MCTLIVLHRCVPGRPLVVAANRDEFFDRPAEGPALRTTDAGPIVAPRDLEAGGTWLGLNAHGVFAGLTNLHDASGTTDPDGSTGLRLRSRGEVVMAALEASSAAKAAAEVDGVLAALIDAAGGRVFNPFQLCVADRREAWLVVHRDRPRRMALEPGIHVVGNIEASDEARDAGDEGESGVGSSVKVDGPGAGGYGSDTEAERASRSMGQESPSDPRSFDGLLENVTPRIRKLARIRGRVEKVMAESPEDLFEGLAGVCREHAEGGNPLESACVHVAERYGTRSSLLLELPDPPEGGRLWTTDGPPCRQPFEDRSPLLRELDAMSKAR